MAIEEMREQNDRGGIWTWQDVLGVAGFVLAVVALVVSIAAVIWFFAAGAHVVGNQPAAEWKFAILPIPKEEKAIAEPELVPDPKANGPMAFNPLEFPGKNMVENLGHVPIAAPKKNGFS